MFPCAVTPQALSWPHGSPVLNTDERPRHRNGVTLTLRVNKLRVTKVTSAQLTTGDTRLSWDHSALPVKPQGLGGHWADMGSHGTKGSRGEGYPALATQAGVPPLPVSSCEHCPLTLSSPQCASPWPHMALGTFLSPAHLAITLVFLVAPLCPYPEAGPGTRAGPDIHCSTWPRAGTWRLPLPARTKVRTQRGAGEWKKERIPGLRGTAQASMSLLILPTESRGPLARSSDKDPVILWRFVFL